MHQLVIVLCDFYVSKETPERELPAGLMLPGLQHATRFATRTRISGGWRAWLSRWLTGHDGEAPATVATAGVAVTSAATGRAAVSSRHASNPQRSADARSGADLRSNADGRPDADARSGADLRSNADGRPDADARSGADLRSKADGRSDAGARSSADSPPGVALMATPVNLIAGMTSIHLDRRSILRLDANDQAALAADFERVFHDSGFHLQPLDAGDFVMLGPQMPLAEIPEPERLLGASMADARGAGATNPALLRLGAEVEMWLHDHAVNDARRRRGEQPVTALWLWGGGPVHTGSAGVAAHSDDGRNEARSGLATPSASINAGSPQSDIAFGRDSYVAGLWAALGGANLLPLPDQLADVFGYPHAQRALLVIEVGLMLQSNPSWTFFDAVAHLDRDFITPAVEALSRGRYERLVILANDYELTLRARDRLKIWRRTPPGLSGLQ